LGRTPMLLVAGGYKTRPYDSNREKAIDERRLLVDMHLPGRK